MVILWHAEGQWLFQNLYFLFGWNNSLHNCRCLWNQLLLQAGGHAGQAWSLRSTCLA